MKKSEQKKRKPCTINGVEIQNVTTPELMNYKKMYLLATPVSLLGGFALLLMGYNFRENLFFAIMLSLFGILSLFVVRLGIRMVKNINGELKSREITDNDKILAKKSKIKSIILYIILAVVVGLVMSCTVIKSLEEDRTANIYDDNGNGRYDSEDVFGDNADGWLEYAESFD